MLGFVCLYAAQQTPFKGAYTDRFLFVHPGETWLKKNLCITSLVTTVACTGLALMVTMHFIPFLSATTVACTRPVLLAQVCRVHAKSLLKARLEAKHGGSRGWQNS